MTNVHFFLLLSHSAAAGRYVFYSNNQIYCIDIHSIGPAVFYLQSEIVLLCCDVAEDDSQELSVSELLERANRNRSECELLQSPRSSPPLLKPQLLLLWVSFLVSSTGFKLLCDVMCFSPFRWWAHSDWRRHCHRQRGREKRRPLHQPRLQVGQSEWWEGLRSLLHHQSLLWVSDGGSDSLCVQRARCHWWCTCRSSLLVKRFEIEIDQRCNCSHTNKWLLYLW